MCDDYVSFEEWTNKYISGSKERWGVGVCWDYCEQGRCDFSCGNAHPTVTIHVDGNVLLSHHVAEWQKKLYISSNIFYIWQLQVQILARW